jgi:two-component system CheB/CheR fusion protein
VGASAGGLEAFAQLLRNLPSDSGMAFVLVQHLAPKHESILASILARETRMSVREATDGVPLEPNHVYVIPPNQDMILSGGHLVLQPRSAIGGRHLPVDLFLRTLADVQGNQAVAVVLSGTGNDGTLGCQAVKAAGGISFAQDPTSARYDGMPRSAIAAGCVDLVMPPDQIAREIGRLAGDAYLRPPPEVEETPVPAEDGKDPFQQILSLLLKSTGTDFAAYKKPTLIRRLRRRMALWRIDRLGEYVRWAAQNPAELEALHEDFLINVTTFFRDPAVFTNLAKDVCPRLVKDRNADSPVRVWVPGCATGEEAYSIAICMLEAIVRTGMTPPIQIFGTDLSAVAITKARAGVYLESIAADVSPERLERFFIKRDGHYQVSKALRDMCVFAQHNLISDPPFSRLDLVSCRNVFIYLDTPQQRRVLSSFHYALKPTGVLFLGSSETVGGSPLFEAVDKEQRVYVKRILFPPPLPSAVRAPAKEPSPSRGTAEEPGGRGWLHREADRAMLRRYGPAGVLVDENLDILQFRGETAAYLEHLTGESSLNLLKMMRKGPVAQVREAIQEARVHDRPARREVRLGHRPSAPRLTIQVVPVRNQGAPDRERCFLVLFEEDPSRVPPPKARPALTRAGGREKTRADGLEDKLALSLQYQEALLEQQEAANEALQSAHEAVLSSNEELQSINEEMETAKEELQSSNEELTTVNEELQNRNLELTRATDDMVNLLASLDVPIVMLGSDMQVRRFTPAAARLFNLIPGDVGRPLADLRGTIAMAELQPSIDVAMDTLTVQTREVADQEGRWYSLRVRPYKTGENRIEGVVLLFVDIDELKKGTQRLERSRAYAEAIVDTVGSPLLILNARLRVERANRSYYQVFGRTPEETEGQALSELGGGLWDVAELRRRLADLPAGGNEVKGLVVDGQVPGRGTRAMFVNARRLTLEESEAVRILISIEDRTEEIRAQRERESLLVQQERAARQAQMASRLKDEFIATVSHELRGPLNAMAGWVHVLEASNLDDTMKARGLAALDRSVKAQTRLIEDLLDMSRIMAGKLRLAHRFVQLADIVRAAVDTATPAAEAKSITVSLHMSDPAIVLGDPDRLQQVVWNLLSNAVKFTPRDGRIDVRVQRQNTSTQLQVTDTGQGIAAEFLPHIFEPFRQADSSPSRSQQGLGLGLAIARHLIESHGGTIRAESRGPGEGATMTVSLPVPALTPHEGDPGEGAPAGRPQPDRVLLAGVRVLVVEDEADSREILAAVLRESGAEVVTADSALVALGVLEKDRPHVLVSDIGMPDVDGFDLIRMLRQRAPEEIARIPAIALTAYTEEESRNKAIEVGFDEHVSKPADPQELIAAVARRAGRGPSTPA